MLDDPIYPDDVALQERHTSYFSEPEQGLDPELFHGNALRPDVREWVVETVLDFLSDHFVYPKGWTRLWIAGSAISYQWSAVRSPADLDVMLGIDYVPFRQGNPDFTGVSDLDIAKMLNRLMFSELYPSLSDISFGSRDVEMTVYVNPGVTAERHSIIFIRPYAAYDLTADEWAVPPEPNPVVRVHPSWDVSIETDRMRGEKIVREYSKALDGLRNARNDAHRINAERNLYTTLEAASALYDEIHSNRRGAFGPAGRGYADFGNYRWQANKSTGVLSSMRRLKDYQTAQRDRTDFETYGVELPDTETLIRRASTYKRPL